MAPTPLADPEWSEAAAICPACGYSLAGIEPPTPCPECGVLHTGKQFIVYGVPNATSVSSPARVAAGVILSVIGFMIIQLIGIVWMRTKWYFGLGVFVVWGFAVLALIKTGPRVKGGKCRLVFVDGGLNVVPMTIDSSKVTDPRGGFRKFVGDERVKIKRVSPVWARLRLEKSDGTPAFEAGIRCPKALESRVAATLERLIRGGPEADDTGILPLTPPTAPTAPPTAPPTE